MKRFLISMLVAMTGMTMFATNDVTLTTSATTFATTYNSIPITAVDINAVGAGNTFCVSVNIANTDFTLAGFEFQVYYPPYLTLLSTTNSEWQGETGATFRIGSDVTGSRQKLPADASGNANSSQVNNNTGSARLGILYTDAMDRLAPGAGPFEIATLCFRVNASFSNDTSCTSSVEAIRVLLVPNPASPNADIFANDSAARVAVVASAPTDVFGRAGMPMYIGDSGAPLKGDSNGDSVRNALDALPSVNCTILATGCPGNAATTLDYNCDGSVNAIDALGDLQLALNLSNRHAKNLSYYMDLSEKGSLVVVSEGKKAAMSSVTFDHQDVVLEKAIISSEAQKAGWMLVSEVGDSAMQYILVNPSKNMTAVPDVYISYTKKSPDAKVALANSIYQNIDYSLFDYSPLIQDQGSSPKGNLDPKKQDQ